MRPEICCLQALLYRVANHTTLILGEGNIGDKGIEPTTRRDEDVIPEAATRPAEDEDVHTGRGGAGNIHIGPEHKKKKVTDGVDHQEASTSHESVADKLKHKVLGVFKKST